MWTLSDKQLSFTAAEKAILKLASYSLIVVLILTMWIMMALHPCSIAFALGLSSY
jgi:hypothetical protein